MKMGWCSFFVKKRVSGDLHTCIKCHVTPCLIGSALSLPILMYMYMYIYTCTAVHLHVQIDGIPSPLF